MKSKVAEIVDMLPFPNVNRKSKEHAQNEMATNAKRIKNIPPIGGTLPIQLDLAAYCKFPSKVMVATLQPPAPPIQANKVNSIMQ